MLVADEFSGPVGYSPIWMALAVLFVGLVLAYYVAVARWAAAGHVPDETGSALEASRAEHLRQIDAIESAVRSGRLPLRTGFQELSLTVRSFVDEVTEVPARYLALEDLRRSADPKVVDAIALMYPPEFGPDDTAPKELLTSLGQARELVRSWT
jgi:hypothetical protein